MSARIPEATIYRLSLYHCYLGQLLTTETPSKVTSKQIARDLGFKEETVRRDVSFVGVIGRPGAGYEPQKLFDAFGEFLGIQNEYPIVRIGSAEMLAALEVVFPPDRYSVRPVAYFSELPQDVGKVINGLTVQHITELSKLDPALGVLVALVACSPEWVQITIDLLDQAGVIGVVLLTPTLRVNYPAHMKITYIRMPCDIKSLACHCHHRHQDQEPAEAGE